MAMIRNSHHIFSSAVFRSLIFLSPLLLLACEKQSVNDTYNRLQVFDGYKRGVQIYQLDFSGAATQQYTLRRRDLSTLVWDDSISTAAEQVAEVEEFRLPGALADFPLQLNTLAKIDWSNIVTAKPAGIDASYTAHRHMHAQVNGETVEAVYWAQQDATYPMDLIIASDNRIIAAIDPSNDYVVVRRGYEQFTSVGRWQSSAVSAATFPRSSLPLSMMPTRSGKKLATRVFLPGGDATGPFATILVRTPYGISDLISRYETYVTRGYAVVLQAVGGTIYWDPASRSEGDHWNMMVQEVDDGADTLNWVTGQPWSDGSICMEGRSYYGYTQWSASMAKNPALKCLVPEVSMGTAFSDQPYMGGTFIQGFTYYTFWMLNKQLLPGRTWNDVLRHRPLIEIDSYATGEDIPTWNRFFENWRNNEFWQQQDWYRGDHARDLATLQIGGWFDDDYPGTRSNWALMQRYGTQPNRLVIGPWRHGHNRERALNGYDYGTDSLRDDLWLLKQKWYDRFLKGRDNGVDSVKVEYFMLGENAWRQSGTWPPAEAVDTRFYLNSGGSANLHADSGGLSTEIPNRGAAFDSLQYDPKAPVKNWYSFDLMQEWGDYQSFPYDFQDIEARADVAVYTSQVLEQDIAVAGNINLILYAATDVKDTDWWAYLSDVAPDNSSTRLSVGVIRARFRQLDDPVYHVFGSNFASEELLSGDIDEVVRYHISIPSIANTFRKGHRIRIAVMNSHDNYAFPNSNTGGDEGLVVDSRVGKMRIHHSEKYPSHVVLPVLPE